MGTAGPGAGGEAPFSVGVTASFTGTPELSDAALLEPLGAAGLAWRLEPPRGGAELSADDLARHDAWILGNERVGATALDAAPATPLVLARFGVGTDRLDLDSCTRHDVIVAVTPDAMARPVAVAALAHLLAATLHLPAKHAMVRDGRWDTGRRRWLGRGLDGRTVGLVGMGNVAATLVELLRPLRVHILAADPFRTPDEAARLGAELVGLADLLARSDAVVVLCPLTPATHHLIGAAELASMRRTAVLVNVARGPVVDQAALTDALERGTIAAAGLDVFESEPMSPGDRLARLPNVSLSPHALAQTDQLLEAAAASAIEAVVAVSGGRVPRFVANPEVLGRASLAARLERWARRAG